MRRGVGLAALAAVLVVGTACGEAPAGDLSGGPEIVVGSFSFSESNLLAEIYAQALEARGADVERRPDIGNRTVVQPLLSAGDVSLVPEYLGTFLYHFGGEPTADIGTTLSDLRAAAAGAGIAVLEPAPAEDSQGLAVTAATADRYGLSRISDLQGVSDGLVFGGPPDCQTKELCLLGLQTVYGLQFAQFVPLDQGGDLTREALASGEIDVGLVFTTSGWLLADGMVLLEDDADLSPAENVVPALNTGLLTAYGGPEGDLAGVLDAVSAEITDEELVALNARVEVDGDDVAEVVAEWLSAVGLVGG